MPDSAVSGFLNINKPRGMTSHDVVARIRRGLNVKKVGHAGTLDPLATGVLVICIGGATRLSEYAMQSTKRYRATVTLGVETDTYDAEGEIVARHDASHITQQDVENVLGQFCGEIDQLPPMYSAIKQNGRKLYELARAGKTVERKARAVTIHDLVLIDGSLPKFTLDVICSAGTYIRSLAYDIGQVLGVGAHMSELVRTASGTFTLENAVELERLLSDVNWSNHLLSPDTPLDSWPAIKLTLDESIAISQGRKIAGGQMPDDTLARGYASDGTFLAVLRADNGFWRPHKVFLPQD